MEKKTLGKNTKILLLYQYIAVTNVFFPAKAISTLRYTEAPQVTAVEEELFVGSGETVSVSFVDILVFNVVITYS